MVVWSAFLAGVVSMVILGRYVMPRFSLFRRLVLEGGEEESAVGYIAGQDPIILPTVGSVGSAITSMHPAGKVCFNDDIFDAMANGVFIDKDTTVVVIRIDGSKLVVDVNKGNE